MFQLKAVILTGGKSTRMGQDKATLTFQNKTWASHTYDLLYSFSQFYPHYKLNEIIFSGQPLININKKFIEDEDADLGPLGAIKSCLNYFHKNKNEHVPWLLFLPVDMPLINHQVLKDIIHCAYKISDNQIDLIKYKSETFPFILNPQKNVISKVLRILEESSLPRQRSLQALFQPLNTKIIDRSLKDKIYFSNFNTPKDLEKLTLQ